MNEFAKRHTWTGSASNVIHRVPFGHAGFMRRVYPGFLQLAGFMAMNLDRHVEAHWQMFQHLVEGDGEPLAAKRAFYEEYRAVMDLPPSSTCRPSRAVFQEHLLPRGLLTHRGHMVDPAAIERTAMLTIEGERDDISGLGQTTAAHTLMPNLPDASTQHMEQAGRRPLRPVQRPPLPHAKWRPRIKALHPGAWRRGDGSGGDEFQGHAHRLSGRHQQAGGVADDAVHMDGRRIQLCAAQDQGRHVFVASGGIGRGGAEAAKSIR